jgi:hypothetical protein
MLLLLANMPKDPSTWVALFVAIGAVAFVMFRPKMKKKDPLEHKPSMSLAQQRSVERQMQNLLVELSEMARQISAQLDTRAAKLELLIKDADQRLAELKRLQAPLPPAPFAEPPTGTENSNLAPPPLEIDPRHVEIYDLADAGKSPQDIAAKLDRPKGEIELILALRPR